MAWYNYQCLDCKAAAEVIKGSELVDDEEWEIIFETSHPMEPTAKELKMAVVCPRCGGGNAVKTMRGMGSVICYVHGNGYFDKAGCHRDMNLHTLVNDDPYAEMREPGEADDLKLRLQRGGQHNPRAKYFVPGTSPPKKPKKIIKPDD